MHVKLGVCLGIALHLGLENAGGNGLAAVEHVDKDVIVIATTDDIHCEELY